VAEEVTFRTMAKQVPVRVMEMLVKAFSFKGLLAGLSIWLGLRGFFSPVHVLIVFGVALFGREFFKYIEQLKGL